MVVGVNLSTPALEKARRSVLKSFHYLGLGKWRLKSGLLDEQQIKEMIGEMLKFGVRLLKSLLLHR